MTSSSQQHGQSNRMLCDTPQTGESIVDQQTKGKFNLHCVIIEGKIPLMN